MLSFRIFYFLTYRIALEVSRKIGLSNVKKGMKNKTFHRVVFSLLQEA